MVKSPYVTRLKMTVDIESIREELIRIRKTKARYYHPFSHGKNYAISLLSADGDTRSIRPFSKGKSFRVTAFGKAAPKTTAFIMSLQGPIFSARFLISGRESGLAEHRDYDINPAFGIIRLHVPILTDPRSLFYLESHPHFIPADGLYFVDVSKKHSTENLSEEERIHLVIDIGMTKELMRLFPSGFLNGLMKKNAVSVYSNWKSVDRKGPESDCYSSLKDKTFQVPRSLHPICLRRSSTGLFKFSVKGGRLFLQCSKKNRHQVLSLNRTWFFCPHIGPGFRFRPLKSELEIEYRGWPEDHLKNKTKLKTLRGKAPLK